MLNAVCTSLTYTSIRGDNGGVVKLTVYMLNAVCTTPTYTSNNGGVLRLNVHMFKVTPLN